MTSEEQDEIWQLYSTREEMIGILDKTWSGENCMPIQSKI